MGKLDLSTIEPMVMCGGEVGVIEASLRPASNGTYLAMKVTDGKITMAAKMWAYTREEVPSVGSVISIKGTGNVYNGVKDITIKRWMNNPDGNINEYRKSTKINPETLFDDVLKIVERIEDIEINKAVLYLVHEFEEELLIAPGAKEVHHHFVGGLLQHMIEVANLAISSTIMLGHMNPGVKIDLDKVIAGALLHDIGKLKTYAWRGIAITQTHEGLLNDHIVEGLMMLRERNIRYDWLSHIVASHHGKLEFGSPVLPATIEAYIVSEADMLSSKAAIFIEAAVGQQGWSDKKNFFLGRKIYVGGEENVY